MSRSTSPIIRRATRVYYRSRPDPRSDNDDRHDANTSFDSYEDHDLSTSLSLDADYPPNSDDQDALNASYLCEKRSDTGDEAATDGDSGGHRWRWQDVLKKIDEGSYSPGVLPSPLDTSGKPADGHATRPGSPSDPDQLTTNASSGSVSSLTNSHRPTPSIAHSRVGRVDSLAASDFESYREALSSSPQTSPHPSTPKSHSSPTPPTSIEMPPEKGKGKKKDVYPTALETVPKHASGSTSSMAQESKRQIRKPAARNAVKAPTKKEQAETRIATARIMAGQSVSIPPARQAKYTLSGLKLRFVPAEPPGTTPSNPLESDPIQPFSSDAPERHEDTEMNLGSLDVDLPDFGQMRQKEEKKAREDANRKRAQEIKSNAIKQLSAASIEDDGSDLEIVTDQQSLVHKQIRRGTTARGTHSPRGRKNQLALAGVPARRKNAPELPLDDLETRCLLQDASAPSFLSSNKGVDKPGLEHVNKLLMSRVTSHAVEVVREKQDDWVRRGGRLKAKPEPRASGNDAGVQLNALVAQRRSSRVNNDRYVEEGHDSDSDHDWNPSDQENAEEAYDDINFSDPGAKGHSAAFVDADNQADDEGEDQNPFIVHRRRRTLGVARRCIVTVASDEDEDAEQSQPSQAARGRILVRDSAFARGAKPTPGTSTGHSLFHRDSLSSLGEQTDGTRTEDGTDKENDVRMSFDRGEDKENTVIAVQSPTAGMASRLGRSYGSFFAPETLASPSGSVARGALDGLRSPLQEIPPEGDEDPFAFTPGPPLRLTDLGSLDSSPTNLGEGVGLEPSFSLKGKERARSFSPEPLGEPLQLGGPGGGGFSQFFTQEGDARGFDQLKAARDNDDISLTQDSGLQPALDVSRTFVQKADEIFGKEQELIAQEVQSRAANEIAPEVFVDENGFLTQTRPQFISPMHATTPGHFATGLRLSSPDSVLAFSARKPLASLLSQESDEEYQPRGRLHKRDDVPSPVQAPAALKWKSILGPKGKGKVVPSHFIQSEAEESDDDASFGFGGKKENDKDEEEDDGEDQDQPLAGLVDDKEMDKATLDEAAVLEKVREHQEADDQENEKLHRRAAAGELRKKRRDHGVGFDDSDSEDDDGREIRPKSKRPRLHNDSIAALAKDPETRAFASEYDAPMLDEDNEFAHLRNDAMDLDEAAAEEDDENVVDDELRIVPAAQLREELREAARQQVPVKTFNPVDVTWADSDDDEIDLESRVREVSRDTATARRLHAEDTIQIKRTTTEMRDADRARMSRWAKSETSSRTVGVTGRNTGGAAAVTGHGKAKAGNGSFKALRAAPPTTAAKSTKIGRGPSILSAVSSRRNKFGRELGA